MIQEIHSLVYLIALGLDLEPVNKEIYCQLKRTNWGLVFQLAKEQSILGIIVEGITKLDVSSRPPQELYLQACAYVVKIEQSNRKLNKQSANLFQLFHKHDIFATLMKGQGVALNYPNPLRRQCGDIDVYVGEDAYNKTNKLLESLGAKVVGEDSLKHRTWLWESVEVEIHKDMVTFFKPSHSSFFSQLLNCWFPNETRLIELAHTPIPVAPPQFEVVYLLEHILEHLLREGIGLRQPIDWLLFLDTHKEKLDINQLENDLKRTGLFELAVALVDMGAKYLGFKQLKGVISEVSNEVHCDILFQEIIQSGNFGIKERAKRVANHRNTILVRKTNSLISILKRLKRIYVLAKSESVWFLLYTIKTNVIGFTSNN